LLVCPVEFGTVFFEMFQLYQSHGFSVWRRWTTEGVGWCYRWFMCALFTFVRL